MLASAKKIANKIYMSLPDRPYIYLFYYQHMGQRLSLKDPRRFTQKIQWLKLHGRLERFAPFADKYLVRQYVREKVGEEYLVPLLGVWNKPADIPFKELPQRFVLKVTTGCNFNIICKDKAQLDVSATRQQLDAWMAEDFYRQERESQYKPHIPRIIAEAYLEDESGGLKDYKVHCSSGEPRMIQVDTDRFTDHKTDCFDTDWRKIDSLTPITFGDSIEPPKRPQTLETILVLARKLSQDFPYVRVDFYTVGNKVYFGELTFTPGSGVVHLPEEGDLELGSYIDLEAYSHKMSFESAV